MQFKDTYFSKKLSMNLGRKLFEFNSPIVMGIVNITPDSFFEGSRYTDEVQIVNRVKQIISQGATIADIGAYSSRPGAKHISEKEEATRLQNALTVIRRSFPDLIVSIDTFRSGIAKMVVDEFGVQIINDISAGEMDEKMFETVSKLNVSYVMMHMQGTPQNMQKEPKYDNLIKDIILYFAQKVEKLKLMGLSDVILDPGFGFGKTLEHNYKLLRELSSFDMFQLPLLVGVSRKSMIYKFLGGSADDALNGTSVLNTLAIERGANILRVHDVKEAVECIKLIDKFKAS